jgi:hypothetical protein
MSVWLRDIDFWIVANGRIMTGLPGLCSLRIGSLASARTFPCQADLMSTIRGQGGLRYIHKKIVRSLFYRIVISEAKEAVRTEDPSEVEYVVPEEFEATQVANCNSYEEETRETSPQHHSRHIGRLAP